MYCQKCGKWIDYQADLCNECKAAAGQAAPTYPQQPYAQQAPNGYSQQPQAFMDSTEPDPTNRTYGIGKAIVSLVFGIVSMMFSMIAWIQSSMFYYGITAAMLMLVMVIALPFTIIGLIFGAKSISCFKRRKNTCAKNIPTLIIGIVGLSESAYGALFLVLSVMMFLIMML